MPTKSCSYVSMGIFLKKSRVQSSLCSDQCQNFIKMFLLDYPCSIILSFLKKLFLQNHNYKIVINALSLYTGRCFPSENTLNLLLLQDKKKTQLMMISKITFLTIWFCLSKLLSKKLYIDIKEEVQNRQTKLTTW